MCLEYVVTALSRLTRIEKAVKNITIIVIYKVFVYTGCHRRNGPNFGRVFLLLNYTDITQNTYIQS